MLGRQISLALIAALALAGPALAEGNGHGKKHKTDRAGNHGVVYAQPHCPPGLAKKSPSCVPPGLAKDRAYHENDRVVIYRQGDVIQRDYILIRDPLRYGLIDGTYYRVGDYVYRVDRETNEVLALMGAVNALLN